MSVSKTKDLLFQLSQLETSLDYFSFDSLNSEDATALKSSFNNFKEKLEQQIFNPGAENKTLKTKKIEKKNDTQFMAHISHEIRTPLNGIIGFANLLMQDNLNANQSKKVKAIHAASHSLLGIINEVLEYSKLMSGANEFEEIDFNLHALVNDVIFLCQTLIVNKHVALHFSIDKNIPSVLKGDPSKLSQILLNLLGNAIKFVEKGTITLQISLKQTVNNKFDLDFMVSDTGIGIAQEKLERIFDSYTQAENDTYDKYGGTGLGLCIVKEIVEKLDGTISVSSKINKGTHFNFNIPYKKGVSKNIPNTPIQNKGINKCKELLQGTQILVFEDNLVNQHLITEQLSKCGCTVFVTADSKVGLNILELQRIDFILMDLKMPGMNGFEISHQIRTNKNLNQIPIIAVSADFTAQDQEKSIASGMNDFLLKPYMLQDLVAKLLKNKPVKPLSQESYRLLPQKTIAPSKNLEVDLESVLNYCCEEIPVLEELIRLFKQNVLEFIGAVKTNLANDNLSEIKLSAHKLKGGIAIMKIDYLKTLMEDIQTSCEQKDKTKVEELFKDFLDSYPICEKNIDESFLKIKEN